MKKLLIYFAFIVLCHSLLSATPSSVSNGNLELQISSQLQDYSGTDLLDGSDNNLNAYPMDIFSLRFN